ncbi:unnamed protein product [Peniophora sp. CBMAI 1063]|nr:unnamed protein product [Peniophora sp. CBMAI 1063]
MAKHDPPINQITPAYYKRWDDYGQKVLAWGCSKGAEPYPGQPPGGYYSHYMPRNKYVPTVTDYPDLIKSPSGPVSTSKYATAPSSVIGAVNNGPDIAMTTSALNLLTDKLARDDHGFYFKSHKGQLRKPLPKANSPIMERVERDGGGDGDDGGKKKRKHRAPKQGEVIDVDQDDDTSGSGAIVENDGEPVPSGADYDKFLNDNNPIAPGFN